MDSDKSDKSDKFKRMCGNTLKKLQNETDPNEIKHLTKRITFQMFEEACRL